MRPGIYPGIYLRDGPRAGGSGRGINRSRHVYLPQQFAANRIKQSLTGHGHASKGQMQRTIQTLWNLPEPPDPPDVADALAIAVCCGRQLERTASFPALQ